MLENKEGQRVPEVTFRTRDGGRWKDVSSKDLFEGRTVVVFSLPGAFTPTCSSTHVPRYNELADVFKANGVDEIVCMSVNDGFVMEAWRAEQHADKVTFIADGNGTFTEGMGLLVDKSDLGFGKRSWRYSMLVKDGVVQKQFIEPEKPGDPFEVSDAETMLQYISGPVKRPPDVFMIGRHTCSHCARARAALDQAGIPYEEVEATPRRLLASSGRTTTPQVFVDGKHLGGADELIAWLEQR